MLDLPILLTELAQHRPVFHSEADFQLALAWQIKQQVPSRDLRLEKRAPILAQRVYADIWVTEGASTAVIELKYKTRAVSLQVGDEQFDLLSHAAQDLGRYDFLKDVVRLQEIVAGGTAAVGYAVFLTNDSAYWSAPSKSQFADGLFRIHHGREVSGELSWGATASAGTMKNREAPLTIQGKHQLAWEPYSHFPGPRGEFRYLLVQVAHPTHA